MLINMYMEVYAGGAHPSTNTPNLRVARRLRRRRHPRVIVPELNQHARPAVNELHPQRRRKRHHLLALRTRLQPQPAQPQLVRLLHDAQRNRWRRDDGDAAVKRRPQRRRHVAQRGVRAQPLDRGERGVHGRHRAPVLLVAAQHLRAAPCGRCVSA
eukprot:TRINITY_DN1215_c0_g1_i1.p1 TRINITY_DN1215_c0_g1~~TRINITY_DN1215_c0_g1_i1.p1  ORF type:complete len:156 (-),score=27.39 TRINITY_DN1215_c0_g1_i1:1047-1514(-)